MDVAHEAREAMIRVADLSHHNNIKLDFLASSGVLGLIHKATQGSDYIDSKFAERQAEAGKLDLLFGSYHFGTNTPAQQQVDHYLKISGREGLKVLDIEENGSHTMQLKQAEDFVLQVKEHTGRWPGLYSGQSFLYDLAKKIKPGSALLNCWLWIARYGLNPPMSPAIFAEPWTFWQYTDKEALLGIDMSRFDGSADKLRHFWVSAGST